MTAARSASTRAINYSLPPRRALLTSPPLSRSVMPAAPATFNSSVGKRQEYNNKLASFCSRAVRLLWHGAARRRGSAPLPAFFGARLFAARHITEGTPSPPHL